MGRHAQPTIVETDSEGLLWVKSSASGSGSDDCVELTQNGGLILVRDSLDRTGPRLTLPIASWQRLLRFI
jgi:hypothetical protein